MNRLKQTSSDLHLRQNYQGQNSNNNSNRIKNQLRVEEVEEEDGLEDEDDGENSENVGEMINNGSSSNRRRRRSRTINDLKSKAIQKQQQQEQNNHRQLPTRSRTLIASDQSQSSGGGGSGLLLRLFQSDFFNVHLAISYLKNYPDSIGITYYLIGRLEQFPADDVEFYWPQLCHLLITRPTKSFALESFIINRCRQSTHLAVKTLWYLQSSLSDLSLTPSTPSFVICRRTFNRIQSIIFSDPLSDLLNKEKLQDPRVTSRSPSRPLISGSNSRRNTSVGSKSLVSSQKTSSSNQHSPPSASSSSSVSSSSSKSLHPFSKLTRLATLELAKLRGEKISEKVTPTAVGIGLALAGVALPELANQVGIIPIEQGRSYDEPFGFKPSATKRPDSDNSASEEELEQSRMLALNKSKTIGTSTSTNKTLARNKSANENANERARDSRQPSVANQRQHHKSAPRSSTLNRLAVDYTPGLPLTGFSTSTSSIPYDPSSSLDLVSPASTSAIFPNSGLDRNVSQSIIAGNHTLPLTPFNLAAPPNRSINPFDNSVQLSTPVDDSQSPTSRGPYLPRRQSSMRPIPSPSAQTTQFIKSPFAPSSSRPLLGSAISQSAPSLPDALAIANQRDHSQPNYAKSGFLTRQGEKSLWKKQGGHGNPILSPQDALPIDPGRLPRELLSQVLKSQSMRAQLELITNLQDIATRLVIVPKKARLSALRAELTVLNHSLPKGCCLGMYCHGSDDEEEGQEGSRKCHHRVVRISPNESVVLNSADRAPFLIHVEVLDDHLNFDPERRSNYEDLRKALHCSCSSTGRIPASQPDGSKSAASTYQTFAKTLSPDNLSSDNSPLPDRLSGTYDHSLTQLNSQRRLSTISDEQLQSEPARVIKLSPPSVVTPSENPRQKSASPVPGYLNGFLKPSTEEVSNSSLSQVSSSNNSRGPALSTSLIRSEPERFGLMEEEIDLVDQVYNDRKSEFGGSQEENLLRSSFEGLNLTSDDSIILSSNLKNKALDEEAWKKVGDLKSSLSATSSSSSPQKQGRRSQDVDSRSTLKSSPGSLSETGDGDVGGSDSLNFSSVKEVSRDSKLSELKESGRAGFSSLGNLTEVIGERGTGDDEDMTGNRSRNDVYDDDDGNSKENRKSITLDEYAERMRMAAIMLAQLNASQQTSQPLAMTPSSAAGMVVGGAIGLGAGFVGVTVGAGLGAVVSRKLAGQRSTVITSPIGRKDQLPPVPGQSGSNYSKTNNRDSKKQVNSSNAQSRSQKRLESLGAASQDANFAESSLSSSPSKGTIHQQHSSLPRPKFLTAQQSQAIKDKIMREMMSLEEERMRRMKLEDYGHNNHQKSTSFYKNGEKGEDNQEGKGSFRKKSEGRRTSVEEEIVMKAINEDDPSGTILGESWGSKIERIRKSSPYGHLSNWKCFSLIVKTGTDLRQEEMVVQLIKEFDRIWREEKCNVWVRYYRILVTGESTGLMETIVDAVSLHSLKKSAYAKLSKERGGSLPNYTMYDYYLETFGEPGTEKFKIAQENFMRSLVSYSIISYILQLKDRHNGNILIDKEGHIIHIDFGFVLSNSPGSIGFEMAPFKLSQDYIEILGGLNSSRWIEFVDLFKDAFKVVRKHAERIITIVELMQVDSKLPCFDKKESTIKNLRDRFQLNLTSTQSDEFVERLILSSASSVFTKLYDSFQYYSQGVL